MPPSDAQWSLLLDFIEDDTEMKTGQFVDGPNGKLRLAAKWAAAAKDLNKLGPNIKTGPQWREAYYGLRARARQALADQLTYSQGTGGGEAPQVEDLVPNPIYARCQRLTGTVTATGHPNVPSSLQNQAQALQQVARAPRAAAAGTSAGEAGPSWASGLPTQRLDEASTSSQHGASCHALRSEISEQLQVLQVTLADLLEQLGNVVTGVRANVASHGMMSSMTESLQDLQGAVVENSTAVVTHTSAMSHLVSRLLQVPVAPRAPEPMDYIVMNVDDLPQVVMVQEQQQQQVAGVNPPPAPQ